jgi:outer membrane protein assembly factor BamB
MKISFKIPSLPRNTFRLLLGILAVVVLPAYASTLEWPCFHGLDRTNRSTETGLMKTWPKGGPNLVWNDSGLGEGYSTVTIASEHIYTAGTRNNQTFVYAFDLNGKPLWASPNGPTWKTDKSWARAYTGSRGTPAFNDGIVYHLGATGQLTAFNGSDGKEIWSIDLKKEYEAELPDYGYTESVLIDGDRLYCNPAGKKAFGICLNKKSGKLVWANIGIEGTAGFSSQILADLGGYRQLVGQSSAVLYGVDTKSGKVLWTVPFKNDRENSIPDPIFYHSDVFASSGYGLGSMLVKLNLREATITPEIIWRTKLLDNLHGGVVQHNGYVYGAGDKSKGWTCLDINTGKQMWNAPGKGSLTYADGKLYCLEENGTMKLVDAIPEKYTVEGVFSVPSGGKGMYWAHPVVCGGRLYIRHADKLFVYDIKAKQ